MEPEAAVLHIASSEVVVLAAGTAPRPGDLSRSHLADGRIVAWRSPRRDLPGRAALDAELADQEPPAALERRFGKNDRLGFWLRWTRMEVACKLLDVPAVIWLQRYGIDVDAAGIVLHSRLEADIVVSLGVRLGLERTCNNAAFPAGKGARSDSGH
jgi:hypothetical protein